MRVVRTASVVLDLARNECGTTPHAARRNIIDRLYASALSQQLAGGARLRSAHQRRN